MAHWTNLCHNHQTSKLRRVCSEPSKHLSFGGLGLRKQNSLLTGQPQPFDALGLQVQGLGKQHDPTVRRGRKQLATPTEAHWNGVLGADSRRFLYTFAIGAQLEASSFSRIVFGQCFSFVRPTFAPQVTDLRSGESLKELRRSL